MSARQAKCSQKDELISMEFAGLRLEIFQDVYEPAEDSFMLAKHAKRVAQTLRGKHARILDMGCGCGIQALVCAKADGGSSVLGVDLNPRAVENAALNAERNLVKNAEFTESDLFSNVDGKFDLIIFNPPYLPTSAEDKVQGKLNLAFDGGKSGRETTRKFLDRFPKHLKEDGTMLMIESSLGGIEKTISKLGKMGFGAQAVDEEKFFFERIVVIEARRRLG